jgi:hypothetical protein
MYRHSDREGQTAVELSTSMISSTLKWVALVVLSALPLVMLGGLTDVSWQTLGHGLKSAAAARRSLEALPALPQPEPQLVKALTAEQALAANGALPFVANGLERAGSFGLGDVLSDPLAYKSALDCLTAAVYYEAAGEGEQGQRAVAQVVLNRVRHPAFPARVCDVVYQGSERQTGCQFTFTCDGSLARTPSRAGWDRARRIATAALAGSVEGSVGMATHYHANWVVPYWAPRLDKIAAVGAHIFYRWPGLWGRRQAFTQRYAGESDATLIDVELAGTALDPNGDASIELDPERAAAAAIRSGFPDPIALLDEDQKRRELVHDQAPGGLIADESPFRLSRDSEPLSATASAGR